MVRLCFAFALCCAPALGCGSDPDVTPKTDGEGPLRIGATAAYTGPQSFLGRSTEETLRAAESQLNGLGGVLGRTIEVDIRDDGSDVALAEQAIKASLEAEPPLVGFIGPSTSDQALAVHETFRARRMVQLAPLAISPALTDAQPQGAGPEGRFLFRTQSSAAFQAQAAAKFLREHTPDGEGAVPCVKAAMVFINNQSGIGIPVADAFQQRFEADGGEVGEARRFAIEPTITDGELEAIASDVLASGAECQSLWMFASLGGRYMRIFRRLEAETTATLTTIGGISFSNRDFIDNGKLNPADQSEASASNGVFIASNDVAPETSAYQEFSNLYKTFTPEPSTETPPPAVYDALVLLALAIERAGTTTDGVAIQKALFDVSRPGGNPFTPAKLPEAFAAIRRGEDINYEGASANCDFDESGDVIDNQLIRVVSDNEYRVERRYTAEELK